MENKKAICFAYFCDGKFIGWYSDTFGTVTENRPKIYRYSIEMLETIKNNLNYSLSKIKAKSELAQKTGVAGLAILDAGINSNREDLSQYTHIELRVVECPYYDGPNPDFDKVAYNKLLDERKQKMTEEGIFDIVAPSKARTDAIDEFNQRNPTPKCDNWIYSDYGLVKEWALNEPTEFLGVLISDK